MGSIFLRNQHLGVRALLGEISYNDGMKIAILGAGASGLYSAILIKRSLPKAEVTVYEKENKLGKKLYATGNGHCNVLNSSLSASDYNDPAFVAKAIRAYPASTLMDTLRSWGVALKEDEELVYPLSYSAESYVHYLLTYAESLGVRFVSPIKITDYQHTQEGYFLWGEQDKVGPFDVFIVACGGKSAPRLGSDGSFVPALEKHGYRIVPFQPGLTPLKLKEDVHLLAGARHHALVKAYRESKLVHQEEGEVLYKKDGISGIAIFNIESALYNVPHVVSPYLEADLFPEYAEEMIIKQLEAAKTKNPSCYLSSLLSEPFVHVLERNMPKANSEEIAHHLKHLVYHVTGTYGFEDSQVSLGGVAVEEVTDHLESCHEEGLYFTGEILNIAGFCGGFNLSWALLGALLVSENLTTEFGRKAKFI